MTDRLKVTVYDGKYTVIQTDTGLRALRYGEEWRDLTGDGLVLALALEVEELQRQAEASKRVIAEWERDMKGTLSSVQLMQAAPKLLAACEGIMASFHESVTIKESLAGFPALAAVAEAIADATGRAA